MTFRAAGLSPPIRLLDAPASRRMPSEKLGTAKAAVGSVPIRLPWTTLPVAPEASQTPLPTFWLRNVLGAPRQVAGWRDQLQEQGLTNSSIRRKMTALRS